MPLAMSRVGDDLVLRGICCGPKMKKKLEDMGLIPGTRITIISNDLNGAFIVSVRGSRLVIGGAVTQQILVDII